MTKGEQERMDEHLNGPFDPYEQLEPPEYWDVDEDVIPSFNLNDVADAGAAPAYCQTCGRPLCFPK